MKFICRNIKCEDVDIEDLVGELTMVFDKKGNYKYKEAKCRKCGEDREFIDGEQVPLSQKNVLMHNNDKRMWDKSSKGSIY